MTGGDDSDSSEYSDEDNVSEKENDFYDDEQGTSRGEKQKENTKITKKREIWITAQQTTNDNKMQKIRQAIAARTIQRWYKKNKTKNYRGAKA